MTAAIEGVVFHRAAVAELRPTLDTPLEDGLQALVRRDLIRPDTADFAAKGLRLRPGQHHPRPPIARCRRTRGLICMSATPPGSSEQPGTGSANSRKLSVITSSRRSGTVSHSDRMTRVPHSLPPGRPTGSRRQDGGRSSEATCPRRSACSSVFPGCCLPTIRGGSHCSSSWAPR